MSNTNNIDSLNDIVINADITNNNNYDAKECENFKLTEKACEYISHILSGEESRSAIIEAGLDESEINNAFIRFSVMSGGCKGMQYSFAIDTKLENSDLLLTYNNRVILAVDDISLQYVVGSTLDYIESFDRSYLKINNPNTPTGGGCGCGNSFTPDN